MASLNELTLIVNELTTKVNSLILNSKGISDLSLKAVLDATEELPIAGSEKINLQQIVDYLNSGGTITTSYVTKSANYTLISGDTLIECNSNTFTITLPTASGISGKIYIIKNTGTGIITIDPDGTETIDSELTQTITQFDAIWIQSNGTNWIII